MFSEAFTKRSAEEIEDYLIVGTQTTTPAFAAVDANWPKPWLFLQVFVLTAARTSRSS